MSGMRRAVSRLLRWVWRFGEVTCSRSRKLRLRLMYPGFSADRATFIGPGCDIRVAPDGTLRVTGCAVTRNVVLTAGPEAELILAADYVGPNSTIVARERVAVGPGTKIAENAVIRDANHDHSVPLSAGLFTSAPIAVGADVWIGAGTTVLAGVRIGDRSTIGAGAVVTRSVPDDATVAGVPARPL
ncbi:MULTISPECIES: acyltransferase [Bacteria]|uniref:acyltransferase n=1 Tax=Bacteria TaxID=2 RepID=UPI003C7D560D